MKQDKSEKAYLIIGLFSFLILSCNSDSKSKLQTIDKSPNELLEAYYVEHVDSTIVFLHKISQSNDLQRSKEFYIYARKHFKLIEPILSYIDVNSYKYLNPPNILKVEEEDLTDVKIFEPIGFQVLEETLYADNVDLNEVSNITGQMIKRLNLVKTNTQILSLKDYNILWLVRDQIIRTALTGVTGFDSPVLEMSLIDAHHGYQTIEQILQLYGENFSDPKLETEWNNLLKNSIGQFSDDFNDFDRYHFIKEYTHPALKLWNETSKDWGVVFPFVKAINNNIESLFSADTFNEPYFSGIIKTANDNDRSKLGEKLFLEKKLSSSQKISCATCHDPQKFLTDGRRIALGVTRNAPTLYYAALQNSFFYDARSGSLEGQIVSVINEEKEFHTDLEQFEKTLEKDTSIVNSFKKLFDDGLTEYNIRNAIASYIRSLSPFDSKFDKNINGLSQDLTKSEINGFNLFMGKAKCATCHFPPVFNGTVPVRFKESEMELIGVPKTKDTIEPKIDGDLGRYEIYKTENRKHFFKTPTVRNVEFTGPYMHNGVYDSLEEVIEFYNKGGGVGLGLELEFQTLPPDPLNLTIAEIEDLIMFMKSLSDKK